MDKKPRGEIKIFKGITRDPVSFSSFQDLMDFQYGTGEKQEKAAEVLFNDQNGVAIDSLDDLGIVLPDFDFWVALGKKQNGFLKRARLYMNDGRDSLVAAKLLQDAGVDFDVVVTKRQNAYLHGHACSPLPILVAVQNGSLINTDGTPYPELMGIKNFCRSELVGGKYFLTWRDKTSTRQMFDDSYRSVRIWSKRLDTPLSEIKDKCSFIGRHRLRIIYAWDLGSWEAWKNRANEKGHIVRRRHDISRPAVVLFADEIKDLDRGNVVLADDWYPDYDLYYIFSGHLYRMCGEWRT